MAANNGSYLALGASANAIERLCNLFKPSSWAAAARWVLRALQPIVAAPWRQDGASPAVQSTVAFLPTASHTLTFHQFAAFSVLLMTQISHVLHLHFER